MFQHMDVERKTLVFYAVLGEVLERNGRKRAGTMTCPNGLGPSVHPNKHAMKQKEAFSPGIISKINFPPSSGLLATSLMVLPWRDRQP